MSSISIKLFPTCSIIDVIIISSYVPNNSIIFLSVRILLSSEISLPFSNNLTYALLLFILRFIVYSILFSSIFNILLPCSCLIFKASLPSPLENLLYNVNNIISTIDDLPKPLPPIIIFNPSNFSKFILFLFPYVNKFSNSISFIFIIFFIFFSCISSSSNISKILSLIALFSSKLLFFINSLYTSIIFLFNISSSESFFVSISSYISSFVIDIKLYFFFIVVSYCFIFSRSFP